MPQDKDPRGGIARIMTALVLKDAKLSRALEICISRRGEQVMKFADIASAAAASPSLIVCDVDNFSKCSTDADIAVCGYENELKALGECEYPTYMRPFDIEQMLDETIGVSVPNSAQKRKRAASDGLIMHSREHSATFRGETIKMSKKEFALLSLLVERKGSVVSREDAAALFGGDGSNVVDVYVKYLREKLDEHFGVKIISSVRGKGYTIKSE